MPELLIDVLKPIAMISAIVLVSWLLIRLMSRQERKIYERAEQEWQERRKAYFKKTGKEAPRRDSPENRILVAHEIDPEAAKEMEEALEGLAAAFSEPDERTPEEIRRDIERERLLAEEAKVRRKIKQEKSGGGDAVADELKALREEEEAKLVGISDPVLIREIRTYYRAKRAEVLRSGK